MCGFVGNCSAKNLFDNQSLSEMSDVINHRGPDSAGTYYGDFVSFAHKRLSIIDLHDSSNQPMVCPTTKNIIIFNGEIYNFREIKKEIEKKKNIQFKSLGDTEVVLQAYNLWGENFVSKLEGMFAFAIWDEEKKKMFLSRDRLGEKPLFYILSDKFGLVFASEIKCFLKNNSIRKYLNIDIESLNQYLVFNYLLFDRTFFKEIKSLNPGTTLSYDLKKNSLKKNSYWHPLKFFKNKTNLSFNDSKIKLSTLLNNSINARSLSDVSNGIFLSSGIDSSVISFFSKNNKNIVAAHNLKFKEKNFDESNYAKQLSDIAKIPLKIHQFPDAKNVVMDFPSIINSMDQPMSDTAFLSNYYLSKLSRNSSKVVLSGDGGDELLSGYITYSADKIKKYLPKINSHFIKLILSLSKKFIPVKNEKIGIDYKITKFLENINFSDDRAHIMWRSIFSEKEKNKILNKEYHFNSVDFYGLEKYFNESKELHYLDRQMYIDLITWFPNDILYKIDRTSMYHSQEGRLPFTDTKLVEFCCSLPIDFKMKFFKKKYILKEIIKDKIPRKILNSPKKGFNSPVSIWLINNETFKEMSYYLINTKKMEKLFNLTEINNIWKNHTDQKEENSFKIFNLMCLSQWIINNNIDI